MFSILWLELALVCKKPFWPENKIYLALLAAPAGLILSYWLLPLTFVSIEASFLSLFLFILWQPFIEELFFRGVLQGKLSHFHWFNQRYLGISRANVLVSLVFVMAHLFVHTVFWAWAVFLPSLVFGYFRDQYQCLIPSLILHSFYNLVFYLFVNSIYA